MLDSMPPAMMDALNMRAFNLTTLSGFYGIMFIYFGLMGAIAAAMWGSDIISKEERDKTVEFSLVLPVSRSRVITAKALAALVNCIAFVLITWGVSLVAVRSYQPDQAFYDFLALEMQAMFCHRADLPGDWAAAGLCHEAVQALRLHRGGHHPGDLLHVHHWLPCSENLDFLKYFTPFKYFDAGEFFRTGQLDGNYLLLSAAIIVVCVSRPIGFTTNAIYISKAN